MAALELHAPMALAEDLETPRMVVFDLDPGPPAAIRECARTALAVRDVLAAVELEAGRSPAARRASSSTCPSTRRARTTHAASFALAVGQLLEKQHPASVLTSMTKADRKGKVFVDWSQNVRHKTTIAPYSMRARPHPTVSTPVTWDEVEEAADGATELRFLWTRRARAGGRTEATCSRPSSRSSRCCPAPGDRSRQPSQSTISSATRGQAGRWPRGGRGRRHRPAGSRGRRSGAPLLAGLRRGRPSPRWRVAVRSPRTGV